MLPTLTSLLPNLHQLLRALSGSQAQFLLVPLLQDGRAIVIPAPLGGHSQLAVLPGLHLDLLNIRLRSCVVLESLSYCIILP